MRVTGGGLRSSVYWALEAREHAVDSLSRRDRATSPAARTASSWTCSPMTYGVTIRNPRITHVIARREVSLLRSLQPTLRRALLAAAAAPGGAGVLTRPIRPYLE